MSLQLFGQPIQQLHVEDAVRAWADATPFKGLVGEAVDAPSALDIRLRPVGTCRPFFVPAAILVLV